MKRLTFLMAMALCCASCFPIKIITETHASTVPYYSTSVSYPQHHTVTSTQVYATDPDISLQLDLEAVAAAFAQSSTIKEFESLLNNSSYIISNLDLNRDGYVDYLRVVSTMEGYNHVFVIQAVLAPDLYQDVATIIAELPPYGNYRVEIVGAAYIYGPNYIIHPVYLSRPYIFRHICRHDYRPWISPWYWDHYPSWYHHPCPVHVNHYHAYIHSFMRNHHYCHEVHHVHKPYFPDYHRWTSHISRDDYGKRHPEQSFSVRNANVAVQNSALDRAANADRKANALDVRRAYDATKNTSSTTRRGSATGASTGRGEATRPSANGSLSRGEATKPSASGSVSRGEATRPSTGSSVSRGEATRPSNGGSVSRGEATSTTSSRVRTNGSSRTTTSSVSPSGTRTTTNRNSRPTSTSSSSRSHSGSVGSSSRSGAGSSSRSSGSTSTSSSRGSNSSSSGSRGRH